MSSNHLILWRSGKRHRGWMSFAISPILLTSAGCSGSPTFNILGSYFPSWIVCLAVAIALTFLAHTYITKKKLAEQLWPLPVVYTALLCLISCALWLIFFR